MKDVECAKSNGKTSVASGEPSLSQRGCVIGEEESALLGPEARDGREPGGGYRVVLSSYGDVIESNKSMLL